MNKNAEGVEGKKPGAARRDQKEATKASKHTYQTLNHDLHCSFLQDGAQELLQKKTVCCVPKRIKRQASSYGGGGGNNQRCVPLLGGAIKYGSATKQR